MVVWSGDQCLLGKRPGRATGIYSAFAGFIDQGETIEEAVRREVMEEVGLAVDDVVYHSSQPWPFPSSLMIGCFAHVGGGELHLDLEEIEDARWFSRDEIRRVLDAPAGSEVSVPGPIAIAHHIIRAWSEGAPAGP
jgi:NAD+ diphosphatase